MVPERLLEAGQSDDPLVDAVPSDQPVHHDRAGLAHSVCASDRLLLSARLELRFHQDDHRSGLQVQSDPADIDLHYKRSEYIHLLEIPYDLRPLADWHVAVKD